MSEFTQIPNEDRVRRRYTVYVSEAVDTSSKGINDAIKRDLIEAIEHHADAASAANHVLIPDSIEVSPVAAGAYANEYGQTSYKVTTHSTPVDIWKVYQPAAQRKHGAP